MGQGKCRRSIGMINFTATRSFEVRDPSQYFAALLQTGPCEGLNSRLVLWRTPKGRSLLRTGLAACGVSPDTFPQELSGIDKSHS